MKNGYLHFFNTGDEFQSAYTGEEYKEPWVSYTVENEKTSYNKSEEEKKYERCLTLIAQTDGDIIWKGNGRTVEYSKNDGEWSSITSTSEGVAISVMSGDTVQFRGNNTSYKNGGYFSGTTCQFIAKGNIMSLIDSTDFSHLETLPGGSTGNFDGLFKYCTGLTDASKLLLPATVLRDGCYRQMFFNCTNLTTAPELPATTLAQECYYQMFQVCTSLTAAPSLPAETLTNYCYYYMFAQCTSITVAPELPATTLGTACYRHMFTGCTNLVTGPSSIGNSGTVMPVSACTSMFQGCTSLVSAPKLPATAISAYCYMSMFSNCSSLAEAPELPATTLAITCYYEMFRGCSSLTAAPDLLALTSATNSYYNMFSGCTNLNYVKCLVTNPLNNLNLWMAGVQTISGTFVKNANTTNWSRGANGIPTNWTVIDAS